MNLFEKLELQQALLAFGVAYYLFIVIWGEMRRKHPVILHSISKLNNTDKRQLNKGKIFRALSLLFVTEIFCYSLYPYLYDIFIPVRSFVPATSAIMPYAKFAGIIFIATSFIYMIWTQLDVEQDLHFSSMSGNVISAGRLLHHSRRLLLGQLLIFVGFSLVLTNIFTAVLLLCASVIYTRH